MSSLQNLFGTGLVKTVFRTRFRLQRKRSRCIKYETGSKIDPAKRDAIQGFLFVHKVNDGVDISERMTCFCVCQLSCNMLPSYSICHEEGFLQQLSNQSIEKYISLLEYTVYKTGPIAGTWNKVQTCGRNTKINTLCLWLSQLKHFQLNRTGKQKRNRLAIPHRNPMQVRIKPFWASFNRKNTPKQYQGPTR